MKHYNRRERKNLAKALGLRTKNESEKTRRERVYRSILAGQQISQQFQTIVENEQRQSADDKHLQTLRHLADGVPLRYSKKELIKEATYSADGKLETPAEYSTPEPIVFSSGVGMDEAKRIMEENYRLREKRRMELRTRKAKQKLTATV